MIALAATDPVERWRDAAVTWGPYAFGAVVLLMVALLLLNRRVGETMLFLAAAAVVAMILFGGAVGWVRELVSHTPSLVVAPV